MPAAVPRPSTRVLRSSSVSPPVDEAQSRKLSAGFVPSNAIPFLVSAPLAEEMDSDTSFDTGAESDSSSLRDQVEKDGDEDSDSDGDEEYSAAHKLDFKLEGVTWDHTGRRLVSLQHREEEAATEEAYIARRMEELEREYQAGRVALTEAVEVEEMEAQDDHDIDRDVEQSPLAQRVKTMTID